MIGDRIKLKRTANRESLQDLANSLNQAGCNITYATLSNYENSKTIPSDDMLARLGEQLGVPASFFKEDIFPDLAAHCFTPLSLDKKHATELNAYLSVMLERDLSLDKLLSVPAHEVTDQRIFIHTFDAKLAEDTAARFREEHGSGELPINSVCNLLETTGWYLFELPKSFGVPALSGWSENPGHLFIAYVANDRPDELRYELFKAVAHSLFASDDPKVLSAMCAYFARAVQFPRSRILLELGEKRNVISYRELTILKQKYGLSRLNLSTRLNELGFLSRESFDNLRFLLKKFGIPQNRGLRDDMLAFHEQPYLFEQKVLRARAEGLITAEEAVSFYPFQFYEI